jgi:hypothetical protein
MTRIERIHNSVRVTITDAIGRDALITAFFRSYMRKSLTRKSPFDEVVLTSFNSISCAMATNAVHPAAGSNARKLESSTINGLDFSDLQRALTRCCAS